MLNAKLYTRKLIVAFDIYIIFWSIKLNKISISQKSTNKCVTFARATPAENRRKIRKVGASGCSP